MKNLILISLLIVNLSWAQDEVPSLKDWKEYSSLLAKKYSINFRELPTSGKIGKSPWAGNNWAASQGGATFRWNGRNRSNYNYNQLVKMDAGQRSNIIKTLSPTEKFDILGADPLWSMTVGERKRASTPGAIASLSQWSAIAGLNLNSPNPVNITNKDGISVPFGESDVGALLALGIMGGEPLKRIYLAGVCNNKVKKLFNQYFRMDITRDQLKQLLANLNCNQMNAASFHVALTNLLGKRGEGLVIEFEDGRNNGNGRIVNSYKITSQKDLTPPPAPGDVLPRKKKLAITVSLDLVGDAKYSWNKTGLGRAKISKSISYTLHINENGEIFGGSWAGGIFPKLFWKVSNVNLKKWPPGLDFIYQASTGSGSKTKRYSGADLKKIFKKSARKAYIRSTFVQGLKEMAEQTRKEREAFEKKVKEDTIDKFWAERKKRIERFKFIHTSLERSINIAREQIRVKDYVTREFYSAMYKRRARIKNTVLTGMDENVKKARAEVRRKRAMKERAIFEFKDRLKVKTTMAFDLINQQIGTHLERIRVGIEKNKQMTHQEQMKLVRLLGNIDVIGRNNFRCNILGFTAKNNDGIPYVRYFHGTSGDVKSVCEKVEATCNSWMKKNFPKKVVSCFYVTPKKVLKGCRIAQRQKLINVFRGAFLGVGVTEDQACQVAEFNCVEDKNVTQKCLKEKLERGDNFLEKLPSHRVN